MMVMGASTQPVGRLAVVMSEGVEQARVSQRDQRAIDGREPQLGTSGPGAREDVLRTQRMSVVQGAKDRHALRRAAEAAIGECRARIHSVDDRRHAGHDAACRTPRRSERAAPSRYGPPAMEGATTWLHVRSR